MADLVKFLKGSSIKEVIGEFPKIIQGSTTDSALDGFKKLVDNNVLSIPLYDSSKNNFNSFLDILDVLHYTTKDSVKDGNVEEKIKSVTCGEIANYSKLDPFVPITSDTNLIRVLQIVTQEHRSLHRLPVVDSDGKLIGIASQSRIVAFLEPHTSKFDFGHSNVGQLGLGLDKKVVTVLETDTVSTAIKKLKEHKISGVGVVDSEGKIVGDFSATDIKYFGADVNSSSNLLHLGSTALKDFASKLHVPSNISPYPVRVTKGVSTQKVISLFKQTGSHRIFVVNDHQQPIGLISLVDIIELFFRHMLIE